MVDWMTTTSTDSEIQARAKEGGAFAIAYALLRLTHAAGEIGEEVSNFVFAARAQADALEKIAEEVGSCAVHLKYLGVGDAASTMGAVEFLGVQVGKIAEVIGEQELGSVLANHGDAIADALTKHGEGIAMLGEAIGDGMLDAVQRYKSDE